MLHMNINHFKKLKASQYLKNLIIGPFSHTECFWTLCPTFMSLHLRPVLIQDHCTTLSFIT